MSMTNKNQKLELTWIGKDNQPKLEPRILIEDPERSYGDKNSSSMLIYGDNLLALKALEQDFAGKIKCIYIDPPFNTGSAFKYYDDGLEHSIWLGMMRDRLCLLRSLLANNGAIFVHIDYNEEAYLRVIMDEIFGRKNFRNTIIISRIKKNIREREKVKALNYAHDVIVFYAKSDDCFVLPPTKSVERRERWHAFDAPGIRPTMEYELFGHRPPAGRHWLYDKNRAKTLIDSGDLRSNPRTGKPQYRIPSGTEDICDTLWIDITASSFKWNFPSGEKNEKLIQRILEMSTIEGDFVLDSFLGSGTTAAVAHKMNRRWIGIELGEHCHTHCLPRLRKVVDGTDQGGISKIVHTPNPYRKGNEPTPNPSQEGNKESPLPGGDLGVGWQGGGGFKYYYLAPSLLKKDKHNNWIIDERYNADMLAAAMAKHEGFRYCPDEHIYWKHGRSTEKDYIFTTTQFVTVQFLDKIHEEMRLDESLLICCKSFQEACENRYANITIKKIPKMLLGRCEFGKEDYSLNIVNLPVDSEPTTDPYREGDLKKNLTKVENKEELEQSNPPIFQSSKGSNRHTRKMKGQKSLFPEKEANEG